MMTVHTDKHLPAAVQRGWSEPSAFGVSVNTYVVSKAPAAQAVNPTIESEFCLTKASSEFKLGRKMSV